MIMKKKWDEKGKTMQFEVKTRGRKKHILSKNKKRSERVREATMSKKDSF